MDKKMKIRTAAVSALALAAACLGACAVGGITAREAETPDYYISSAAQARGAEYILRDCGGYIGVYSADGGTEPENVTDIEVAGLRRSDRELLRSGIPVSDRSELLALLEDFGS